MDGRSGSWRPSDSQPSSLLREKTPGPRQHYLLSRSSIMTPLPIIQQRRTALHQVQTTMSLNPAIHDQAADPPAFVGSRFQPQPRYNTSAKETLKLILDQDRRGSAEANKKNASRPGETVPGVPPQGKPRLMLMGQRR